MYYVGGFIIFASLLIMLIRMTICSKIDDPVPSTPMSKDQQRIVGMLRKEDSDKFKSNLWDNICPLCGKETELHTYGTFDQFSDHWCVGCGFVTKMEVLA